MACSQSKPSQPSCLQLARPARSTLSSWKPQSTTCMIVASPGRVDQIAAFLQGIGRSCICNREQHSVIRLPREAMRPGVTTRTKTRSCHSGTRAAASSAGRVAALAMSGWVMCAGGVRARAVRARVRACVARACARGGRARVCMRGHARVYACECAINTILLLVEGGKMLWNTTR